MYVLWISIEGYFKGSQEIPAFKNGLKLQNMSDEAEKNIYEDILTDKAAVIRKCHCTCFSIPPNKKRYILIHLQQLTIYQTIKPQKI